MKLTIFGATGATGKLAVQKALQKGHLVTAYARNSRKLRITHEGLRIVEGELTDKAAIGQALEGSEAVLSFLGPKGKVTDSALSDGVGRIVDAMEKRNIRRLIALGTRNIEVREDGKDFRFWIMVRLLKLFAPNTYWEVINMGKHIQGSKLDWTIVRVPWLTDSPASGKLHVGFYGGKQSLMLSREDMADFFLNQINDREFIGKAPALSNAN